jgi:serine/threonine protein kinase/tetratricopeptide (TPR) repeat protein
MDQDSETRLRRLEDAIEAWLARDPAVPSDSFLDANAALRDLLEPMLHSQAPDAAGAEPLQRLGDLALRREIGRGGMGVVYEAEDRKLHRKVAVKVMRRTPATSSSAIVRFWREAALAASMQHPGVVPVHYLGETDELFYLVMQLEEAASLSDVIAQLVGQDPAQLDSLSLMTAVAGAVATRFPGIAATSRPAASYVHAVVDLMAQVAEALGHAHSQAVIHRDVKPGNILVDTGGRAYLTDFGLACVQSEPGVTHTGDVPGTAHYMAPEQIRGGRRNVGPALDVFALGATIYELLTLRRAFGGSTVPEVLYEVVHREVVDPLRLVPSLPRDLVAIVHRCLEKDPGRRYPDGAALALDLRAFLRGDHVAARPPSRWQRVRRWARREPWRAVAAVLLLVGLPTLGLSWAAARRQQPKTEVGERVLRQGWLDAELAHGFREAGEGDSAAARAHFEAILREVPDSEEAIAGLSVLARLRDDRSALAELTARPNALATSSALRRRQAMLLTRLKTATEVASIAATLEKLPIGFDAFLDGYGHLELGHRAVAGEYELASKALHRALVTSDRPRSLFYYEWLHAAAHARDQVAASEASAAIRRLWPDDAASWFWIAFAADERGDTAAAFDALEKALANDPGLLGAQVYRAKLLRRTGKVSEAIAALRAALPAAPKAGLLHKELATCLCIARQFDVALASFEIALAANPTDGTVQREYAVALLDQGEIERAFELADGVVKRHPGDHEARTVLAAVLLRRGETDAALEHLRQCLASQPTARAWFFFGMACAAKGDPDGARDAYEKALSLDASHTAAAIQLAFMHLRDGDREQAELLLRRAIAVEPTLLPARRALLRVLDDRPEAAVAMCRDWLQHAPRLPEAQRHLASSLLRTDDAAARREALQLARAAVAATGDKDGPALHVLGQALLAAGEVAEAEATLARALAALDPADRFTPHYRGQIELTLEQCRRARKGK